jgi:1,4-alpha-glucan branching enzyme
MNALSDSTASQLYSARNSLRPVNFYCSAPGAKSVCLAGDFNHWHPIPMHQRVDGWWFIQLELPHGHHQYHFLVDGQPTLDPQASGTVRDSDNQPISLIAVS